MDKEFINSYNDYVDNGNAWFNLNPLSKLCICLCIGLTAVVVRRWQYGFSLCLLYCIAALLIGIFPRFIKNYFAISIILFFLTIIVRQFSMKEPDFTPFINVFGWQWYKEPFIAALNIVSYIMGCSGALLIFFQTTEMRDIMLALENRGVTHVASYIMLSSMQSVIDMRKSAETILESQKARGIETDGNIMVRMKAFFPILGPILLSAMSGTEEKAIAMDARAFSHEGGHTYLRVLRPISKVEYALDALAILCLIASIVWKVLSLTGVL
ncbi:MAG: energy-coupling factor transporter transmembrane protein EcfT [Oscillospiraceae bacterium]|nr:energy-coupling factor transporter transmembrane protein EcfT [Oscillospiraceae bacterium]